ncbi:TPA: type II restriction endonuclease [Neisseria meningitidis]|uniref:type II restriction endonuclease n=1 Tax=Neisseria meningitidis TaxID=487 RepID=UPI001EFEDDE9|nr:type II restriction endonuclease [Neisseria meningitidis]
MIAQNSIPFDILIKLPKAEEDKFGNFIKEQRKKLIAPPKETAKRATETHRDTVARLLEQNCFSKAVLLLRELSYEEFLKQEAVFNGVILKEISRKFDAPKNIIDKLSGRLFELNISSKTVFQEQLVEVIGQYTSAISPYIYQLCLSNTQSRRSRAGKTFEGIVYFLYEYLGYPFDSQSQVGKEVFAKLGLGKLVDSILPSIDAFNERRDKTVIGTMKTTLRERWQEVVEEVSRSNVPNIYLLTVDDDIFENKVIQMNNHNIVLVVPQNIKKQPHLKDKRSVIDFESYFLEEIPNVMKYWKK